LEGAIVFWIVGLALLFFAAGVHENLKGRDLTPVYLLCGFCGLCMVLGILCWAIGPRE
jgi:hypothetical protein